MRLAAFILANVEPILQNWEDFARSLGRVTASMDVPGLRDHAELILTALAADLETVQTGAQQEAKSKGHAPERSALLPCTAATAHGAIRAQSGFSLVEMVSEYRALRASVLRLWARVQAAPDPASFQELVRFNEAIDEALADSVRAFSQAVDEMAVTRARRRMESLGLLAAGLGHDMANVLLPMRCSLDGLIHTGLAPAAAPLVDALSRAVEHLAGLTKGLRALSMDPDKSGASGQTSLHEWWTSAISPFTWSLPQGVRLHAQDLQDPARALPPVRVPAHALMQAVFNLVQNAGQALGERGPPAPGAAPSAPGGNIWITATFEPRDPGSPGGPGDVHLSVRDDGPGMDEATAAHCTEAFFTTKAKDLGTGLGLFLVRMIVERYGGKMIVSSKAGLGSAFTLVLPTAAAGAPTVSAARGTARGAADRAR